MDINADNITVNNSNNYRTSENTMDNALKLSKAIIQTDAEFNNKDGENMQSLNPCNGHSYELSAPSGTIDLNGFQLVNRNQSEQCYETSENIIDNDCSKVKVKKTTEVIMEEVFSKESQRLISPEEMAAIFGNQVEFDKEILVDHDISSEDFNRIEKSFDGKINDNIISCIDVKEEHAFEQLSDDGKLKNRGDEDNIENINNGLGDEIKNTATKNVQDKPADYKEGIIEEIILQTESNPQHGTKDQTDKKPGLMDFIRTKTRSLSRDRTAPSEKDLKEQADVEKPDKKKFKINLFNKQSDTPIEKKEKKKIKKSEQAPKDSESKMKLPKFLTKKSKDIEVKADIKPSNVDLNTEVAHKSSSIEVATDIIEVPENFKTTTQTDSKDIEVTVNTELTNDLIVDTTENNSTVEANQFLEKAHAKDNINIEIDENIRSDMLHTDEFEAEPTLLVNEIKTNMDADKEVVIVAETPTECYEVETLIDDGADAKENFEIIELPTITKSESQDKISLNEVKELIEDNTNATINFNLNEIPLVEDISNHKEEIKNVPAIKSKDGWWNIKKKPNKNIVTDVPLNGLEVDSQSKIKNSGKTTVVETKDEEHKKHGTFPKLFSKKPKIAEEKANNLVETKTEQDSHKGLQKKFSFGLKLHKKSDKDAPKSNITETKDQAEVQLENTQGNLSEDSSHLQEVKNITEVASVIDNQDISVHEILPETFSEIPDHPKEYVLDVNLPNDKDDSTITFNEKLNNPDIHEYDNKHETSIVDPDINNILECPKLEESVQLDKNIESVSSEVLIVEPTELKNENTISDVAIKESIEVRSDNQPNKSNHKFHFGSKSKSNKGTDNLIADNGIELIAVKSIPDSEQSTDPNKIDNAKTELVTNLPELDIKRVESGASDDSKSKRKPFALKIGGKKNKHDNAMKEKNDGKSKTDSVASEEKSADSSLVPSRKSSVDNTIDQKENNANNVEKSKIKHPSDKSKKQNQIGSNFMKLFSPRRSKNDKNGLGEGEGYEAIVYSVEEEGRIVAYSQKKRKHSAHSLNKVEVMIPGKKVVHAGEIDEQPAQPNQHFIVVAIDFGTTFSGYAFSFVHDPDSIHMMRKWEGGDPGVVNQKTPTILLLTPEGEFHSFGFTARDFYHDMDSNEASQWLYFERFKMNLFDTELTESSVILAANGKPYPALALFAYALSYFKKHAMTELSSQSSVSIEDKDIRWVITVPAIWRAPAKQFMREAAYMADIASPENAHRLLMALEPEAASICIRRLRLNQLMPERSTPLPYFPFRELHPPMPDSSTTDAISDQINPGTRYMVVDCGGGTVDITVHEMEPGMGHLKELHKATGGPHGSTGVDREFEKLLTEIFGEEFIESFKSKRPAGWVDLMIAFESRKRAAAPFKENAHNISLPFSFIDYYKKHFGNQVDVAIKKYGDKDIRWSVQGMLRLSPSAMQRLFDPTLTAIKQAIRNVFNKPDIQDIEYLFMVGGFSESPLLQHEIRKEFENEVKIIIPQDVSLAILKGAVQFGLDPTVVTVRRSRQTYGVGVVNHFVKGKHPVEKKVARNNVDWCVDLFDVFVAADEPVALGTAVKRRYAPAASDQQVVILHVYCSESSNVTFISDPSVVKCATLRLDIDPANPAQAGQEIEVGMTFADTEIKVAAVQLESGSNVKSKIDFLNK